MQFRQKGLYIGLLSSTLLLSACIAKNAEFTEQQMRMQRCDQYLDTQRDDCLRGEAVTIDDYKEDLKSYNKSRKKEAEKALEQAGQVIKPKPTIEPEVKQEDKP